MTPAYIAKLCLNIKKTDFRAQKIDDSTSNTFEIVLANFQLENKLSRARFFQKTFVVANNTLEVILKISFLILSNVDIQFA